jgi:secretion/DNA translocation related CpaE-like protein
MSGPHVLVAVDDGQLHAAVVRLAAVAGVATRQASGADVRAGWHSAAAVVLDPAAARWCVQAALPRRLGVLLVAAGDVSADLWPLAVGVGADALRGLPRDERQVADWLAGAVEPDVVGRLVACLPARAGAGASTLAATLGLAAGARGHDALVVDADPWAGGIDFLLGIEDLPGARWDALAEACGVVPAASLAQALPSVGGVRVLSCARSSAEPLRPASVEAGLNAGRRAHTVVVADLPGVCCDAAAVVAGHAETALVVVPAEVRAVAAASGLVAALTRTCPDVRLVVRRPGPGGLRPRDVSEAVGAPVAAVWPWDRRLAGVVERGRFAREWRRTGVAKVAVALLDTLAVAPR